MKKKVISLFLVYFLLLLVSCKKTSTYITIHSAKAFIISLSKNYSSPYIEEFNRDELGLAITPDRTTQVVYTHLLMFLASNVYGMEDPNTLAYENEINSVNIFTVYDYDEEHPAQSNINDILKPLMGAPTDTIIPDLGFTSQQFKLTTAPTSDSLQLLITGSITGKRDFEITTPLVVLE